MTLSLNKLIWSKASLLALFGALVLLCLSFQPAFAQSGNGANNAAPVCLELPAEGGSSLVIVVPATDARGMRAKGFTNRPCQGVLKTQAEREAWRDKICDLAALPLEDMQKQFEATFGERPQVLCGMAERAAGKWTRSTPGQQ